MRTRRFLLCAAVSLVTLLAPASAGADHEGTQPGGAQAPPGAPQAPPAGPGAPAATETETDEDDTSAIVIVGALAGLLALGGGLFALRESRRRRLGEI